MFLLTKHAKEKIRKRLLKKRNVDNFQIWSSALEFAKKAIVLEDEKFIYFTDGKFTLVVTKERKEPFSFGQALKVLRETPFNEFYIFDEKENKLIRVNRIEAFRVVAKAKEVYLNKESPDIYIGKPRIALTLRPAKEKEKLLLDFD